MNALTAAANYVEAIKNQESDAYAELLAESERRVNTGTMNVTDAEEREYNKLYGRWEALRDAHELAKTMFEDIAAVTQ